MSVCAFDHPFLSGLIGDEEVAGQFSAAADIAEMLRFEIALANAEAAEGVIDEAAADAISQACRAFNPDMADLRQATTRDGVVVPALLRQLRTLIADQHAPALHLGATSQDVVDTSLVVRLSQVAAIIGGRLENISDALDGLGKRFAARRLTGRTRMRRAIPIQVGDRLAAWQSPLVRYRELLPGVAARACVLQFGGAAGTRDVMGDKASAVADRMGRELGLPVPRSGWHAQRDGLIELAGMFARISGSLGKIGQDIGLMNQDELAEITLSGGGGSSAMAHKQNPVGAEVLVALARFNAVQISAMHQSLVHEQERSGAAWTLEWMVLPQICVATGSALTRTSELLASIHDMGTSAR
jgi:3-carboxy-cis,cis-muconate cycloisomerase